MYRYSSNIPHTQTYTHTCTHIHTYIYPYLHTNIYMYIHTYIYTCIHTYICIHTFIHKHSQPNRYTQFLGIRAKTLKPVYRFLRSRGLMVLIMMLQAKKPKGGESCGTIPYIHIL